MNIALALIKQLVSTGQLGADDVAAMCADLTEADQQAVQAAWIEAVAGGEDYAPPKPTLRVVD